MKIIVLFYRKRRRSLWAEVSRPMWKEPVKRCRSKPDIKLSSEGTRRCRWPVRLTHLVAQSNKHKCTNANAASTHQHVCTATHTRTRRPSAWAARGWRDALNTFSSIIFPLRGFQSTSSLPQHYIMFAETLPLVGLHWNSENRKCNSCRPTSARTQGDGGNFEWLETRIRWWARWFSVCRMTSARPRVRRGRGHESLSRRTVVINEVITGHVTALL